MSLNCDTFQAGSQTQLLCDLAGETADKADSLQTQLYVVYGVGGGAILILVAVIIGLGVAIMRVKKGESGENSASGSGGGLGAAIGGIDKKSMMSKSKNFKKLGGKLGDMDQLQDMGDFDPSQITDNVDLDQAAKFGLDQASKYGKDFAQQQLQQHQQQQQQGSSGGQRNFPPQPRMMGGGGQASAAEDELSQLGYNSYTGQNESRGFSPSSGPTSFATGGIRVLPRNPPPTSFRNTGGYNDGYM